MVTIVGVEEAGDPRLGDYVRLRDVDLRQALESEHGLFLAEGEKVIRRAVAAGYPVRSLLMSARWLDALSDVLEAVGDAQCFVAEPEIMEQVTGFHVHRGALASLERLPLPSVEEVVGGAKLVLVLEDLVDHTNVGAIFRSAAALGADAVLLSPRCADPLYRRSVKVSMGAVFSVPYARVAAWYDGPAMLRERGFQVLALTPGPDALDLDTIHPSGPIALLVGTEGEGLSDRWMSSADALVRIPMTGGVDSLNVAAAVAVACYQLRRRPRGLGPGSSAGEEGR